MDGGDQRHDGSRGLTLPETLLATVVLGFAVAALTHAIVAGQMQTQNALHEHRAVTLAEAMMEEILSLPYHDPNGYTTPGPDPGENSRQQFNNMDDYHGFTMQSGEIMDLADQLYPSTYQMFSVSVTAQYDDVTVPALGETQAGLIIEVAVSDPGQRQWRITRFVPEPETSD